MKRVAALLLLLLAVCAGCQDKSMRGRITAFGPIIVTDEAGARYVITHAGGNTYTVMPVKLPE